MSKPATFYNYNIVTSYTAKLLNIIYPHWLWGEEFPIISNKDLYYHQTKEDMENRGPMLSVKIFGPNVYSLEESDVCHCYTMLHCVYIIRGT